MSETLHIVCPRCDTAIRVPAARLGDRPKCGNCHKPLFDSHPIELGSANFEQHLRRNDIPMVVDFWAPWCGPCRLMAPAFEQAAAQLEPRVRLAKVNTEVEQRLAAQYQIRSIPTLAIFHGGREIARRTGAMGAAEIIRWITGYIAG